MRSESCHSELVPWRLAKGAREDFVSFAGLGGPIGAEIVGRRLIFQRRAELFVLRDAQQISSSGVRGEVARGADEPTSDVTRRVSGAGVFEEAHDDVLGEIVSVARAGAAQAATQPLQEVRVRRQCSPWALRPRSDALSASCVVVLRVSRAAIPGLAPARADIG